MVDCLLLAATWAGDTPSPPWSSGSKWNNTSTRVKARSKRVEHRFSNNLPGVDWCHSFLKRNHVLANRLTSNIKTSRAQVSPEIIESYFYNLKATVKDVLPGNIINYDETNLTDDPGTQKVLGERGAKRVERVKDSSKQSTSVMFAVTGSGTMLPPNVVY